MKKKVLLVEDARDMQLMVSSAIRDKCDLTSAASIAEARQQLSAANYALLILDVHLPDGDGFEFCKGLRQESRYADLPIIFLTGESDTTSRVRGFELGGDDYVTKPFEPTEFAARVQAKLKKDIAQTLQRGNFRVDLKLHKVYVALEGGGETALNLTPLEYKLLTHFLQHEEKIFSRQELLGLFWGQDVHVSDHTVDTHISSLRKKMGDSGSHLRSVFRKGYTFASKKMDA